MSRRRQIGQARLFALLAVLLGLLAMHGLASTHHAAAATTTAPTAQHVPAAAGEGHAGHDSHQNAGAALDVVPAAALSPAASAPACSNECQSTVGMLCVAVIGGLAAAAMLARRRASRTVGRVATPTMPRPSAARRRRSAPPDPVAELCVSRT